MTTSGTHVLNQNRDPWDGPTVTAVLACAILRIVSALLGAEAAVESLTVHMSSAHEPPACNTHELPSSVPSEPGRHSPSSQHVCMYDVVCQRCETAAEWACCSRHGRHLISPQHAGRWREVTARFQGQQVCVRARAALARCMHVGRVCPHRSAGSGRGHDYHCAPNPTALG